MLVVTLEPPIGAVLKRTTESRKYRTDDGHAFHLTYRYPIKMA